MRLRDWLLGSDEEEDEKDADSEEGSGDDDDKSIIDEEEYPEEDIREDKVRLQDQRRQAEKDVQAFRQKYYSLIEKGQSDDINDDRRKELAHKAKMVKKKYNAAKQKLQDIRMEMALVVSIEAVREIMSITGRNSTNIGQMIDQGDIAADKVQQIMEDIRVEHGIRQDEMQEAISSLDVDMMPNNSDLDESEEYKMMVEGSEPDIDDEKVEDPDVGYGDLDDPEDINVD